MTSHCTDTTPTVASADQWAEFRRLTGLDEHRKNRRPPAPPFKVSVSTFTASDFVKKGAPASLESWVGRLLDAHRADIVEDTKAMVEKASDGMQANMESIVARMVVEVMMRLRQQEGVRR